MQKSFFYNYIPRHIVLQQEIVYNTRMDRTILHCDLNNFYASVEQKAHPEYDGMPLAVCGDPEVRHGIVLAKNMLAKQAGVTTGEAVWISKKKCPGIVFVPPHYDEYVKYSKQVFGIYTEFTDRVESFGLDECWLDVTGSLKLFGCDGKGLADRIRETVKERTGLTISVGVSFTKVLAKLGSDLKKPDATVVLDRAHYMDIVGGMAPSELIMIGKSTAHRLELLGIRTIRALAAADRGMLREHFGVVADKMSDAARGIESEEVRLYYDKRTPKSVSHGTTTPRDITSEEDFKIVVYALAELVAMRLRRYGLSAEGVGLSVREATTLHHKSAQCTLPSATCAASEIAERAIALLPKIHAFPQPLRAVTVAATRLTDGSMTQLSLFDGENDEKETNLGKSIDRIRGKYGYKAVKRGLMLKNDLATNLHEDDDFLPFKR